MPRFYTRDAEGTPVLLLAIDPITREVTYRADEEAIAKQTERNTERLAQATSELAMRDPTSPVFSTEGVVR